MASKLGVTALYVTPLRKVGGPLTPGPPGSPPLVVTSRLRQHPPSSCKRIVLLGIKVCVRNVSQSIAVTWRLQHAGRRLTATQRRARWSLPPGAPRLDTAGQLVSRLRWPAGVQVVTCHWPRRPRGAAPGARWLNTAIVHDRHDSTTTTCEGEHSVYILRRRVAANLLRTSPYV